MLPHEERPSRSWKTVLSEVFYEFYSSFLLNHQMSFMVYCLLYAISILQVLDFLFQPFFSEASNESFVSNVLLNAFTSILLCQHSASVLCINTLRLYRITDNRSIGFVALLISAILMLYIVSAYPIYLITTYRASQLTRKINRAQGMTYFCLYLQLFNMILFYPSALIAFSLITHRSSNAELNLEFIVDGNIMPWGSGFHIATIVIMLFLLFMCFFIQLITVFFTSELSPKKLVTWSSVSSFTRMIFTLMRLYQAIMLTVGQVTPIVPISIFAIIALGLVILKLGEPAGTIKKCHYMEAYSYFFIFFMSLFILANYIWGQITCPIIVALILSSSSSFIYLAFLRHRSYKLLTTPYVSNIKSPTEAYELMSNILSLLEYKDEESRVMLAGVVLNHNRLCENSSCWCQDVKNSMSKKGKDPGHEGEVKESFISIDAEKAIEYQNKTKIGRWLLSLTFEIMGNGASDRIMNSLMNIVVSYIYFMYIGNSYQSLNYMEIAQAMKPGILESFAIYLHRRRIEGVLQSSHEQNIVEGAMPIDVIEDCSSTYQGFWKELLKDAPDSEKLSNFGKEISLKWEKIQKLFNKLLALMPKNMNYLYLFGLFLKYIANDSEEAKKIHQKLIYIRSSKSHLKGPEFEKFQEEGRAMLMRVSGGLKSIGIIKEINVETERILGYPKAELKGLPVTKLMCQTIRDNHEYFMRRFYETLISNKVNHSTFQYVKEYSGYYMPVQMLIRVVPSIEDGLEFCGIMYKNDKSPYLGAKVNKTKNRVGTIICDEQYRVLGVTKNCAKTLRIREVLIKKGFPDQFMQTLFPVLKDNNAVEKLTENRGRVINYNYDRLQEFYADEEEVAGLEKGTGSNRGDVIIKKLKDILLWMRIVKQDYSDSKAVLYLVIIDQVPNIDSENYIQYDDQDCHYQFYMNPSEGAGPRLNALLPKIFRRANNIDSKLPKGGVKNVMENAESVFAESMLESLPSTCSQSSSSIGAISKDLTTFKERIAENEDPKSVKRLRIILIIFVFFIIAIVIAELVINITVIQQFSQQFTFVGALAERFTTFMLSANRVRIYSSLVIEPTAVAPTGYSITEADFSESKAYLQTYANSLVKAHQKIVQMEDELNLEDGASTIDIYYKNKYMENDVVKINFSFSIMEYLVKLLQLISYNSLGALNSVLAGSDSELLTYVRTRDFLLYNANASIRVSSENIMSKYLDTLRDQANAGEMYEIILNSSCLGLIIVLFLLIVPIVIRVIGEKSKVMAGFAYITKKEILEILTWASAFDISSSSKSFKLLAENRRDKVYELIEKKKRKLEMKAKHEDIGRPTEEIEQRVEKDKIDPQAKLRALIKTIFHFNTEEEDLTPRAHDSAADLNNAFPARKSKKNLLPAFEADASSNANANAIDLASNEGLLPAPTLEQKKKKLAAFDQDSNSGEDPADKEKKSENNTPSKESNDVSQGKGNGKAGQGSSKDGSPDKDDEASSMDASLADQKLAQPINTKKANEEKILQKQKKERLKKVGKIHKGAFLKVGLIFILFIVYSVINIVYIYMFNKYASDASTQYNNIQWRRPLLCQLILMSQQTFFENDTAYIKSSTNSLKRFPEYQSWLLGIEDSILSFEKAGAYFIFSGYISKMKAYNSETFCGELALSSSETQICNAYDSGFYKNGLRASIFRFVSFWQGLGQQFMKESNKTDSKVLWKYQYNEEGKQMIAGSLKYLNTAILSLINIFDSERETFLRVAAGISWGKAMGIIFILLLTFVIVFISFLSQMKQEIWLMKAMMKMIPVDLLKGNGKLLKKVLRGSAS